MRPTRAHVVLGARVRPNGQPSAALVRRALTGARAIETKEATLLILSGGGIPSEAAVAAELVEAAGIPPARLRLDEDARDTVENIVNAWAIAQAEGYAGLVLISDRTHLPRALLVARVLGVPARGLAPDAKSHPVAPKAQAKAALRELVSLPTTLIRATRARILGLR